MTPSTFMVHIQDGLCPPIKHEFLYSRIGTTDKHLEFLRGGHLNPAFVADDQYVQRIVQTIETGKADPENGARSSFLELIFTHLT